MVCTFLIVRGNPPVLLEPVDQSLYTLTQPINRSIKRTASKFIFLMGDGDANATAPQISPDMATAIGLIAHHTTRTMLSTAWAASLDRTTGHERFEPNGFVPLSRHQDEGYHLFLTRRSQMNFGAEALASTQGFSLSSFGRTCRVLMDSNDGTIDIVNGPVRLVSSIPCGQKTRNSFSVVVVSGNLRCSTCYVSVGVSR
jgi:hypothetical protein